MTITGALILFWISWAMGLYASMGFAGFARADQQQEVLDVLEEQRVRLLEEEILKYQRDFCASEPGSRPRAFYLSERNKRLNQYQTITGSRYDGLPDCQML